MRKKQKKRHARFQQQTMFNEVAAPPPVVPESVPVVIASLVELLMQACASTRSEVSDESKGH
jgi:hypothetical protein